MAINPETVAAVVALLQQEKSERFRQTTEITPDDLKAVSNKELTIVMTFL